MRVLYIVLFALFVQLLQAQTSAPLINRRIAYVIGNAEYEQNPLYNPVNDARDVAKALETLGFEVKIFENLKWQRFKNVLKEYGEALQQDASHTVRLFYYSGHGCQVNGRNYLLPVDAHLQNWAQANKWGISTDLLMGSLKNAQNATNIVVLDACRFNELSEGNEEYGEDEGEENTENHLGFAAMDAPIGTFIAFSTAPSNVASDGRGLNSLYTQELVKTLQIPDLNIEQVFKKVRSQVNELSQGEQVPWDNSSLEHDFYFYRSNETVTSGSIKNVSAPQRSVAEQYAHDVCTCLSPVTTIMDKIQAMPSNTSGEKLSRLEYDAQTALQQSEVCIKKTMSSYAVPPTKAEEQQAKLILEKTCPKAYSFFNK